MDIECILDYGVSKVLTKDECLPTEEEIQFILSRLEDYEDVRYCVGDLALYIYGSLNWKVVMKSIIVMNHVLGVRAAQLPSCLDRLVSGMDPCSNSSYFKYFDEYDDPSIRVYYEWISTYVSYFIKRLECFSRLKFDVVTYSFFAEDSAKDLDTTAQLLLQLPALKDLLSDALRCQTRGLLLQNSMVQSILEMVAEQISKIQNSIREISDFQIAKAAYDSSTQQQDQLDVAITAATDHTESLIEQKYINVILQSFHDLAAMDNCLGNFALRLGNTDNWVVALKILIVIHKAMRDIEPSCMNLIVYIRTHNILGFYIGKSPSQKYRSDGESVEIYCELISAYASYLQNRLEFYFHRTRKLDTTGSLAQMQALLDLCRRALCCYSQGAGFRNSLILSQLVMVADEIIGIHKGIKNRLTATEKMLPEFQPYDADNVCNIKNLAKQQLYELKQLSNPATDIHRFAAESGLFLENSENFEGDVPSKRRRTFGKKEN